MSRDERLDTIERQVAALSAEVIALRAAISSLAPAAPRVTVSDGGPAEPAAAAPSLTEEQVLDRLRRPPSQPVRSTRVSGSADWLNATAPVTGAQLESLVGRYGTLALAALVILMAVGAVIKMAVQRGLLTPEVRILGGLVVAIALAVAGLMFRRRGEVRYGGALLALSLAVIDLVAWGAGPRFALVPTSVALAVVDVASLLLAALALHDESEFLFAVALAGALSAPFVTADQAGSALMLLSYGGVVIAGAARVVQRPAWLRVFALLVVGALVFALAAAALPVSAAWYGPFLISLFSAGCALVVLLLGEREWRSELSRALIAVGAVGTLTAIDVVGQRSLVIVMSVAVVVAMVTHAALLMRDLPARVWRASALLLPLVSLGIAVWATESWRQALVIAGWVVFSMVAWQVERRRQTPDRSATHLLAAGLLGMLAVTSWLWGEPLPFVAGLAAWGVVQAWLGREERSSLPLIGVVASCGAAALFSIDQLASRNAFGYTPFMTRSSASALVAAAGLAIAGAIANGGSGGSATLVNRGVKLGVPIGFLIVWGRMEVADAFNADVAAFLLTSYYAACGVGSIIAGRGLGIGKLRVAGLCLAIYAAVKAVVEVTNISSLPLRVGAYAAVGVFLLGAGYLYREREPDPRVVMG